MPTVVTQETEVGTTHIHCPVCKSPNVSGTIIELRETIMQALVIPISKHTSWWVVCSSCKAKLFSKVGPEELEAWTADELVGSVYLRVPLPCQLFAVLSIGLALEGVLHGTGSFGLIAWLINRKYGGWVSKLSKIGLWASVLLHVAFGLFVVIGALASQHAKVPR